MSDHKTPCFLGRYSGNSKHTDYKKQDNSKFLYLAASTRAAKLAAPVQDSLPPKQIADLEIPILKQAEAEYAKLS
jgi:hypothetical protein